MMKGKRIKLLAIALTLMMTMGISTGCIWLVDEMIRENNTFSAQVTNEPQLTSVYNEAGGYYDVALEGLVKNPADKRASISISATIYDADGNVIGEAYDYIQSVSVGETWRFCARAQTAFEAASYRIDVLEAVKEIY